MTVVVSPAVQKKASISPALALLWPLDIVQGFGGNKG